MKRLVVALTMLATGLSSQVMAEVDPPLCAKILARPSLGLTEEPSTLTDLYASWDTVNGWRLDRQHNESFVSIAPSAVTNLKISIDEQANTGDTHSVLQVDCPLPTNWSAVVQPKIKVAFPSKIVDSESVTMLKESHTIQGFTFSTVATSRESLMIHGLWRVLETTGSADLELPSYVQTHQVDISHVGLAKSEPMPVRAFRMSAEPNMDQQKLWHLILPSHVERGCANFAVDLVASEYFELDLLNATQGVCQIELLTYWDAQKGKVIECSTTANYNDPKHCARFNMQRYWPILERLRQDEPFYVELLVKLGKGFVLTTYEVDNGGIVSVRQMNVQSLAKLQLPIQIDW